MAGEPTNILLEEWIQRALHNANLISLFVERLRDATEKGPGF